MEEDILQPSPEYKMYSYRSITLSTFLGGPLATGYLIAENFRQLGETAKFRTAWIVAIASTAVIIGVLLFVPGIEKAPSFLFPVIYMGIASFLVKRYQGEPIKVHQENGGQFYSVWRGLLAGVIAAVATFAVVFGLLFVAGATE